MGLLVTMRFLYIRNYFEVNKKTIKLIALLFCGLRGCFPNDFIDFNDDESLMMKIYSPVVKSNL